MKRIKIQVNEGEELIQKLNNECQKLDINEGTIVSVIGAVDSCCLINMNKDNAKESIQTEYNQALEISGNGEIVDGKAHIHSTLSKQGDIAIHGHLVWAKVKSWFVHINIITD